MQIFFISICLFAPAFYQDLSLYNIHSEHDIHLEPIHIIIFIISFFNVLSSARKRHNIPIHIIFTSYFCHFDVLSDTSFRGYYYFLIVSDFKYIMFDPIFR